MYNFADKHILVTGASSGIGRETCLLLAKFGARITAVSRNEVELSGLINELNQLSVRKHSFLVIDLKKYDQLSNLVASLDSIDGLVHAAGIVAPLPTKFIRKKHIDNIFEINTYAPILLTAELLTANKLNDSGSIVFISSISTQHPYFGGALYVSSKAALESYSRNLALELSYKKIRSNVVSPALVKTKIFEQTVDANDPIAVAEYEKQYPFGFGEPVDVANAIAFFLSDSSKWITGQNLLLEGGLTLNTK